jgi:hypothetical protein
MNCQAVYWHPQFSHAFVTTEMPTLDVVAQGTVPLPNSLSYYALFLSTTIYTIGIIANSIVFFSNVSKPNSISVNILLSILAADWLFCSTALVLHISAIIYRGYIWGRVGCYINYYIITVNTSVGVITLACASWERYCAVVKGHTWARTTVIKCVSAIWIYSCAFSIIPFFAYPVEAIRLEESGWSCLVKWYGRDWASLTQTLVAIFVIMGGITIVLFSYISVYREFVKVTSKKKKHHKEARVFYMCLIMTGSFVVFWTPSLIYILYELITGSAFPSEANVISGIFGSLSSMCNSQIMLYFDNRIRGNVLKALGLLKAPKHDDITSQTPVIHAPSAPNDQKEPEIREALETRTEILSPSRIRNQP